MTTGTAYCLIRQEPVYRRESFVRGLSAHGYRVTSSWPDPAKVTPDDVLVIWNRYNQYHELATRFERKGAVVLVAENAYVGVDRRDRRRYALARGGHNGSGTWYLGGGERWQALGIGLAPWRTEGEHVLVLPNRCFGRPDFVQPAMWVERVVAKLKRVTARPIRVRPHPGNDPPKKPLADDLRGAWAAVIWSSSAGCEALLAGIPVFYEAPWWVLSGAAERDLSRVDNPAYLDRLLSFERLAWAQWHVEEIERGEPFQHLLQRTSALAESV